VAILLCAQGFALWFDLTEEISSRFKKPYNWWLSDEYIERTYSSNFSKNPFVDAMANVEDMSMQLKVVWVQYVESALSEKWCSLSNDKIWAILYYFLPEFRAEIARSLKMELWDYDSKKYVFDEDVILKYCAEYFDCAEMNKQTEDSAGKISSSASENLKTNCQEFFQLSYREWQANERRIQNTHMAQLWSDRYWNETTEDSPYDIMIDLWVLWKLYYQDAEEPISPVFYDVWAFSKSKSNLNNNRSANSSSSSSSSSNTRSSSSSSSSTSSPSWSAAWTSSSNWNNNSQALTRSASESQNGSSTNPAPLPLTRWSEFGIEWWYDRLVEWLSSFAVEDQSSKINCTLCGDGGNSAEQEPVAKWESEDGSVPSVLRENSTRSVSEFTAQEYQELVDYMTDAVDKYASLPEDKDKEMDQKAWDTSAYVSDESASQLEKTAKKIKKCYESCEDLRIDQKATCMIKCTCWEIESPVFNPDEFPWLGPIFIIRFCSVPSTDTKFSIWWKRIHSLEEWFKEIFGAVDKLSREWRLWIWTQQYNFLDSTTKKINIADTFAFTIDVEFVDISNKMPEQTEHYKNRKQEKWNEDWQLQNGVANPINNPVTRNSYRLIASQWEVVDDFSAGANADTNRKIQADLSRIPEPMVSPSDNSDAYRYNVFSSHLWRMMDQIGSFRTNMTNHSSEMNSSTKLLYSKKWRRDRDERNNKSE